MNHVQFDKRAHRVIRGPSLGRFALGLALFGFLALGAMPPSVLAQGVVGRADLTSGSTTPIPTLMDVSDAKQTPRQFTVAGQDFTPGGRVYLAIYDQMGAKLYETRWVTVSRAASAINFLPGLAPEAHPIVSTTGGGTLRESFGNLCGANAMMRGLDQHTGAWSNWINVQLDC